MDTICLDCVFAEWHGNKQSDCKFDRLYKFKKQGAELVLDNDGPKEYVRIKGRFCNTCRAPESVKDILPSKWAEKVRQEVTTPIAMAVYVDKEEDISDAIKSLDSFVRQTVPPQELIVIYNVSGSSEAPSDYVTWFLENADHIKWRLQTINGVSLPLKEDLTDADYGQAVDISVQSEEMKSIYFTVCWAGYIYPEDYVETIDKAINDEMQRFVALLPDENGNGLLVQRRLHKLLQGNKKANNCNTIIEKIQQIASEEGTGHMVKRFEDLR